VDVVFDEREVGVNFNLVARLNIFQVTLKQGSVDEFRRHLNNLLMEIPEQDFYEEFFVGKFGDEGLNCKFTSGSVDVDIATSRTEETLDISAGIKLPLMFGNFECGMTSAGRLNFGLS